MNTIFERLTKQESQVCFLTSACNNGWKTIAARNPAETFSYTRGVGKTNGAEQFLSFSKKQLALGRLLVGAISYDLGYELMSISREPCDDLNLPDIFFYSFDDYILRDDQAVSPVKSNAKFLGLNFQESSPFTQSWYKTAYTRAREHIRAGDIYQINLTHRLEARTEKNPRSLFTSLMSANPAPFLGYLEGDGFTILVSSPERFVSVRKGVIETYPIKGTRPRGQTRAEDERQKRDLLESEKERAELMMITDLLRNDIGKVSEIGSVEIVKQRGVTAHRSVWHTNSHVQGCLRKNMSSAEAIISMFPGGSVTGCPKKRAMEIIAELEPRARGFYTGVLGYIEPSGDSDMAIIIRSLIKKNDCVYLNVGGGIVYDSKMNREWKETFDKAAPFFAKI